MHAGAHLAARRRQVVAARAPCKHRSAIAQIARCRFKQLPLSCGGKAVQEGAGHSVRGAGRTRRAANGNSAAHGLRASPPDAAHHAERCTSHDPGETVTPSKMRLGATLGYICVVAVIRRSARRSWVCEIRATKDQDHAFSWPGCLQAAVVTTHPRRTATRHYARRSAHRPPTSSLRPLAKQCWRLHHAMPNHGCTLPAPAARTAAW